MLTVIQVLFAAIFIYLAFSVLYLLVFAIAGRLRRYSPYAITPGKKRIAVLICSYKEDNVILGTARKAAEHNYPGDKFDVIIAADQTSPQTIAALRAIPVTVYEMDHKGKSSKSRSLNVLLNALDENAYDIALVLDGDNVMMPDCLEKLNSAFHHGFRCVQLHRTAKNTNNEVAVLDGLSEEINNNIFRNGQRALGFSSCLIGSGMAFEYGLLKEYFNVEKYLDSHIEDRVPDAMMVKQGVVVEYIPDTEVYDEKVASGNTFEKQRIRWMEAQHRHLQIILAPSYFKGRRGLQFWNRLVINTMPPRLIMIAAFLFLLALAFLFTFLGWDGLIWPGWQYWLLAFAALLISLLVSIPPRFMRWSLLMGSVTNLLSLMRHMVMGVFQMKTHRKEFMHTPKVYTEDNS
jgi:cellulose synthase/poly-beta-1,6-N-acetylglucosamine synthase-like glycosyltransferase